jgi:broad specificity phosphatase PhoE
MHLFLIRHGERADETPNYTGGANSALSPKGEEQSEALAEWLAAKGIDALYSSCLLRAIQTGQALQRKTGLPQQVWPVFCETESTWQWKLKSDPDAVTKAVAWRDGESWDDQEELAKAKKIGDYYLLSEIGQRFPHCELTQPFRWPDAWWKAFEGQTMDADLARIRLGVEALLHKHGKDDRVAVVCHANSASAILSVLLGLNCFPATRFSMCHTAVHWVEVNELGRGVIRATNSLYHLPPHLRVEWQ